MPPGVDRVVDDGHESTLEGTRRSSPCGGLYAPSVWLMLILGLGGSPGFLAPSADSCSDCILGVPVPHPSDLSPQLLIDAESPLGASDVLLRLSGEIDLATTPALERRVGEFVR